MKRFYDELTNVCHQLLFDSREIMYYLKEKRGISNTTIESYRLGAFPKDLRDLYRKYKINPKALKENNIIWNANESQFRLYPIVIPITDVGGKPVAIGCRTLLTEKERKKIGIPKYRNSNYKKTSYLFGLNKAVESIRSKDLVYIVEGYFDVITAHQNGISNVVATCGTMLSERQLITLSRYTSNICILFDNDIPGHRSAQNILSKFSNNDYRDVSIKCKFTPKGYKDLDEYLNKSNDTSLFGPEL